MVIRYKTGIYPRENVFTKGSPPIAVIPSTNLKKISNHKHEFNELVIVCKGDGTHIRNNESSRITQGDVFFIPEGLAHRYESDDGMNLLNIVYDHSLVDRVFSDLKSIPGYHAIFLLEPEYFGNTDSARLRLSPSELDEVLTLTQKIQKELSTKSPGYLTASISCLLELLVYISRRYTQIKTPAAQHFYRLGVAMSFLEKNYCSQISIAALASKAHLSQRQFHRIFQKITGITPLQYQLHMRTNFAQKLLESTSMNITEISAKCGFDDSCYFSRIFRQHTGMAPRDYRSLKRHEIPPDISLGCQDL